MNATTTPLDARRLGQFTNPTVEVLAALLTLLPFVLLAAFYRELPARVPMHWDITGRPDGWAEKSIVAVFAVPLVGLYMQGLALLVKHGLLTVRASVTRELADRQRAAHERYLRLTMQLLDWIRVTTALLLAAISLGTITGSLERYAHLSWLVGVGAGCAGVLLLAGVIYWSIQLVKVRGELRDLEVRPSARPDRDPEHWRAGLFYVNADDPAIFVEKRIGVGYTLNFGNRRAYLYLAYIFGLPLLVAAGVALR